MNVTDAVHFALYGLERASASVEQAAGALAQGEMSPERVLALKTGERAFEVNARVLATAVHLERHLLDILI